MTFSKFKEVVSENDTVIIYISINNLYAIEVTPFKTNKNGQESENIFQTQYGALKVSSLIGMKFGSRVQFSRGWGIVLYPTPELWTITLSHRTQILYATDIAMIIGYLNISPGSVVCEAGTGSGSLSHSILRTVGDAGHLYTADFHQERVLMAEAEFKKHGLGDRVSIDKRDVYSDGWQVTGAADAVFLDVPKPWLALHHAVNAIKVNGGRICSFSPCIEQVSRSCSVMREMGLQNIKTIEVLLRELQVRTADIPVVDIRKRNNEPEDVATEEEEGPATLSKKRKLGSDYKSIGNSEKDKSSSRSFICSLPCFKQAGHTGYLTFCHVPIDLPRPATLIEISNENSSAT